MVPALALFLLAAEPAARFDAFMKAHPTFVATVDFSAGGKAVGTGTLRLSRPRRMRFDFRGKGFDYGVSSTEAAYVEIDRIERVYDERPAIGGIRMYESRVSPAQGFLPGFLVAGVAAGVLGPQATSTAVAGGDELRTTTMTETGPLERRLLVDPQGRPVRFWRKSNGEVREWRVTSFGEGKADPAGYVLEPPLGYVPHALPDLPYPLQIGDDAPLTGWRRGGAAVDLHEPQRGRPRLLAVLGADCPASAAARPSLAVLARSMPVLVIGPGEITDPSGAQMRRLSPPGTPMFYLVGVDGTVRGLWFGFDPAKAAAWQAEIAAAAK